MRTAMALAVLIGVMGLCPVAAAPYRPEVWMGAGDRIYQLLEPGAQWDTVRRGLTGVKLYVDQFALDPPERLKALATMLRRNRLKVVVELGCCLDFGPMDNTNGDWSSKHELEKIDRWYAAGGKVDYVDLDGPVRRLLFPEPNDDKHFTDVAAAVEQAVVSVRAFHRAHPDMRFWHLTNFPNWGYKGDVSYHARGPNRQDYGEYDTVHRMVAARLKAAGVPLSGVSIDNPYDYLIGEHMSVNLHPATSVNWLKRVREYEDRCRREGLEVGLIVNSERGGMASDALFASETLKMVDTYLKAGGRPTRFMVQTWYPYPKRMAPESDGTTMAGLVKAVIERVRRQP